MLHDLLLKNSDEVLLAIAKIDITNDTENIAQKQTSVSDISFITPVGTEEEITALLLEQQKIERFIQPRDFLMQELLDRLTDIEIVATFGGEELNPAPTTTTTTAAPTTTTTTAG